MSRLHNPRPPFEQQLNTPAPALSEADRERYNSEFDHRENRQPGHELGIPGFARLKIELSEEELSEAIWNWHGAIR